MSIVSRRSSGLIQKRSCWHSTTIFRHMLSNQQKAEALNKQFQLVFTKEHDRPIPDKGPSPHPTIPDINITTPGILKLLHNLDIHKASDPDSISPRVLKETAEPIALILRSIFTFFMDSSTVPDDWRNAYITPIYKKGDHSQPSNYRPISLSSIVSKIFEHILSSHITKHLAY